MHVCNYLPGRWIIFSQWHPCCRHGIRLQASFRLLIVLLSLLQYCASADIRGLQMSKSSALYYHLPVATGEAEAQGSEISVWIKEGQRHCAHSAITSEAVCLFLLHPWSKLSGFFCPGLHKLNFCVALFYLVYPIILRWRVLELLLELFEDLTLVPAIASWSLHF